MRQAWPISFRWLWYSLVLFCHDNCQFRKLKNLLTSAPLLTQPSQWRIVDIVILISFYQNRPAHDTATDTEWQLPEVVLTQFLSPDVEHDVLETCREFDLHTTRPPTQSNSYQRLYWHNLSLLMMSTMCSKHVESSTCTRHGHRHRVTVTRGCIDTICLSWRWARCARNM
jgi:hypothetical protein